MSDIFEEVEDSLRQDRATELWKRFGPFVWLAAGVLVAAVAWREYASMKRAETLTAEVQTFEAARDALAEGNYSAAETGFRQLIDGETQIAPLATHLYAQSRFIGGGDTAGAADALDELAGIEGPLQRLALLKAAYIRSETLSLSELEAFLGDLPQEESAIGVLALELVAAKAYADGDLSRAREEFSYLRFAANAPQGVPQRAERALAIIPATPSPAEATEAAVDEAEAVNAPEETEE
ncbi:MAG: tetratricopeptide repeat protein [Pseudomonadota bacterium]